LKRGQVVLLIMEAALLASEMMKSAFLVICAE
jgi:hypothetical protein